MLVRESISFQKTRDPKKALDVSVHAFIEEWLEEMSIENYIINDDLTIDVNGDVYLSYKNLTAFPKYIKFKSVGGYFSCHHNQLTSLEGCPSSVGGGFSCSSNQLTSLKGCPSSVGGGFNCYNNKKHFTKEEVRKYCKVDKNKIH
jgi:hypothetical protein